MDTRRRILDAALSLFSEKGYANVFVAEIADAVGIKAPSLYKHFAGKQEIFDAIVQEIRSNYDRQAAALSLNGSDAMADAAVFAEASEEELVKTGLGLFRFFLHDDTVRLSLLPAVPARFV